MRLEAWAHQRQVLSCRWGYSNAVVLRRSVGAIPWPCVTQGGARNSLALGWLAAGPLARSYLIAMVHKSFFEAGAWERGELSL
jgi:hypothetical protein